MPTRSEQRRINVQQGKPVNYGLEPEYIERETVVAFLENMAASRYLIQCFENKEKFPAADVVEIKHGNWIEDDWVEYDGHSECIHHSKAAFVCSNCRHAFKKELLWIRNYCPNCGTKMDDCVEVVRCKDCIYNFKSDTEGYFICSAMTNPNYVPLNHFCSYGERKENENET